MLEEDITESEKVEMFEVYIYPYSYGKPILVYEGITIGHKHICKIPMIRTQKLIL